MNSTTSLRLPRSDRPRNARPKTPLQHAQQLIDAAREVENSKRDGDRKLLRLAIGGMFGSLVIAALAVGAVLGLTPLKTVVDRVIYVDKLTGASHIVEPVKGAQTDFGELNRKYWIRQYVLYREGYDWETIQATHDATKMMSEDRVAREYSAIYSADNSPHKVLQNRAKVIPKVLNISFVGDMAQVRMEKRVVANDGSLEPVAKTTTWVITMSYRFAGVPDTYDERLVNPQGFKVTSYRADMEIPQ